MYTSKGSPLARSFNPDTENEDESEMKKPITEKFLFGLTLQVRKNCSF